jgi:uncharacterized protein YbjT (DUF2867 family)
MTVMVTGASGPIGHALIPLLVRNDEVRAAVRRPDAAEPLRSLGAKVTVGRTDDADALAEVLRGVYSLIHLVGGPNHPAADSVMDANHGSVIRSLDAAKIAGVHRFVLVSVPGASPDADDVFLRAKGLAEEAVIHSGLEHAVIRPTHVCGLGSFWLAATFSGATATPPFVLGSGDQAIAPVAVEDVAAILAAADDRHGELAGWWALEGPDVVLADDLVPILVGEDAPQPVHLHGEGAQARLSELLGRAVSAEMVARLEAPSRADAPDAAAVFGVSRTPLATALRRTLERAATGGG